MSNNTISALGQKEAEIVARLSYEKKDIVTARELDIFLPSDFRYRKQLVYTLKRKKILIPIKRGVYIYVPLDSVPTGRRVSELLIPPIFFPKGNYYVGYSTMYNYYSLTEQLFQTVYVLNTTLRQERIICGVSFKFLRIPLNRMYGLEKIKIRDTEVIVSSRERTLIDLLYFNKPVGGVKPAMEILKRVVREKQCDVKKLVQYAAQFSNVTARKRIGVVLEDEGVSDTVLKPLIKSVRKTAISALEGSRKGRINKKWKVIIHDS